MNPTTPQSMSDLPELPEPSINTANHASVRVIGYTADQLREYGRLCRATAEQPGKVEGEDCEDCASMFEDALGYSAPCPKHRNAKPTQPAALLLHDIPGSSGTLHFQGDKTAATQQPVAWVVVCNGVPVTDPFGTKEEAMAALDDSNERHADLYSSPLSVAPAYIAATVSPSREVEALDASRWNVLCNRIDTAGEDEWATWLNIFNDARNLGAGALEQHLDRMVDTYRDGESTPMTGAGGHDDLPAFLTWVAEELLRRDTRPGTISPGIAQSLKGRAYILRSIAPVQEKAP